MWLLVYSTSKPVQFNKVNNLPSKDELLKIEGFMEAYIFGEEVSLYLSNNSSDYVDMIDKELEQKNQYIDECMYLRNEFKIDSNDTIKVRNYYDFTKDNILYIKSTRLVEMVVKSNE